MPSTVNGIGTHYWGKKNVLNRPGVCPHCHRSVTLTSYDTWLCFVIVFIPIIPLARKRIIDKCPACTRHYAIDLKKWEAAKEKEISGALQKFQENPSAEAAIGAHKQLLGFHQTAEAESLQKMMAEKYAGNADVQVYLAGALTQLGKYPDAAPFFARALELRPDLPAARVGVARTMIREKRLDDARRLLDFLEKPGAAQTYSLEPLEELGDAFRQANRHKPALELYERIIQEFPAVAQHKGFRKRVQACESALKSPTSILPRAKFSWRNFLQGSGSVPSTVPSASPRTLLIILGSAAALTVIGFALSNEYIRHNRSLYVVNQLPFKIELTLDNGSPVKLPAGLTTLTVSEGHHQARITGEFQQTVDFDMNAAYFSRWFSKPVWVLNPGGAAIIYSEHAVYGRNPPPATYDYFFGDNFRQFNDVAYPFTDLPKSLSMDSHESERTIIGLGVFDAPPLHAFYALEDSRKHARALDLAEWHLSHDPEDKEMLRAYAGVANTNEISRVENFLSAGLTNRPIAIEWHRTYQDLLRSGSRRAQLDALYENMLQSDPTNSALLYLRGRLKNDRKVAADYFTRSEKADPNNPYPIHALAVDDMAAARWPEAKTRLDRVVKLDPDDRQFRSEWATACVATGQFDVAEKELRGRIQRDPTDWKSVIELCDVLAAEAKRADADQALAVLDRAVRSQHPEAANEIRFIVRCRLLYAFGDFAALEQEARRASADEDKAPLFFALVEQNRPDEAARALPMNKVADPLLWLGCSLAFQLAGKTNEARQWQEPFIKVLRAGSEDSIRAADLLEGKLAPTPDVVDDIALPASLKGLLLAKLALTHPDQRDALNAAARRLNVERVFPYHLVQRTTAPAH